MADLIQFRGDVASRWKTINPVLAERELGIVTDSKGQFKVGDGVTAWNNLPLWGFNGTLVSETGSSEESAASQKLVTDIYNKLIAMFPKLVTQTEKAVSIVPNTMNVWGSVTELAITFTDGEAGAINEYMIQFTTGNTAPTVSLPTGIVWANDDEPSFGINTTYQISVLNGLGVYAEFQKS